MSPSKRIPSQIELVTNKFLNSYFVDIVGHLEYLCEQPNTKSKRQEVLDYSREIYKLILKEYPPHGSSYKTAIWHKSQLNKYLRHSYTHLLVDSRNRYKYLTVLDEFERQLNVYFSAVMDLTSAKDQAQFQENYEQRTVIDTSVHIQKAHQVLKAATEFVQTPGDAEFAPDWTDVAFSLVLVTGRRSVEIMQTGEFWVPSKELLEWSTQGDSMQAKIHWENILKPATVGRGDSTRVIAPVKPSDTRVNTRLWLVDPEHTLAFKGTAKGKGRFANIGEEIFFVTTLVPANLVLGGLEYLKLVGKKLDPKKPTRETNNKCAKPFERAKVNWQVAPKATIHTMRQVYFLCLTSHLKVGVRDYKYLSGAIGHVSSASDINYETHELAEGSVAWVN